MSRSHIRPSKVPLPAAKNRLGLALAALIVTIAGAICLIPLYENYTQPFDRFHETAAGTILDTRIVPFGVLDGGRGGRILYRIEARVHYFQQGQWHDRWLPVGSNYGSSRENLEARLALKPQTCEVYWAPGHADHARCRFYAHTK